MNAVILTGSALDVRGAEVRDLLTRAAIPFEWHPVTGATFAAQVDDQILVDPDCNQIASLLGWAQKPAHRDYDLAIYGGGPAGLSAAVYGASEGLKTVIIERATVGGQAGSSSRIENFVGFPQGIAGWELAERTREQACRLGAEIVRLREAVTGRLEDGQLIATLDDGQEIHGAASIIATGVGYNRLGLDGEDRYLMKGLYYGAGASEARFVDGRDVFVVGGGNSAGQAAINFAQHGARVRMLVRGDGLAATMSTYLIDEIAKTPAIEVLTHTTVTGLEGIDCLTAIMIATAGAAQPFRRVETEHLFICIGGTPNAGWLPAEIRKDGAGYILTGRDLPRLRQPRMAYQTIARGVFAAGDVRHGAQKRVASAVGEGAGAVSSVHEYLATLVRKHAA